MQLTKLEIRNYRLLVNADLDIDKDTTLIVGRNNSAKTSCMDFLYRIISGNSIGYDDYPLSKRESAVICLTRFIKGECTYEQFCVEFPKPSMKFFIDYSHESNDDNLGALSPFIIDVDESINEAIIFAEYRVKISESELKKMFDDILVLNADEVITCDENIIKERFKTSFPKTLSLAIEAINPSNPLDTQIKSQQELIEMFPFYIIRAERDLDETGNTNKSSLQAVITNYFCVDTSTLDPTIASKINDLRSTVEKANHDIQKSTDTILSNLVDEAIGFGYPNAEELQLGVSTNIAINNQIQDNSKLTYIQTGSKEELPSDHNGLGYKNLIKIQFQLAQFAEIIKQGNSACIPLLFIEEPESHMHPQMQQTFITYLESFLNKISNIHIQVFITSHSSYIANTIEFSKIRYAQRTTNGVIYKNLNSFTQTDPANVDFIKKYLTINRCDLFFADKAIFIEGASERLLLPDMIKKCENIGLFDSREYKLSSQYYALIEVGGAYAHRFIPFVEFLDIPSLIITDIDSIKNRKEIIVSLGTTTSNGTIKYWIKRVKGWGASKKISLSNIQHMKDGNKTINRIHLEFQTAENGLCGRSLEEAIRNVNRSIYGLTSTATEDELTFKEKSKTEFALNLIFDNSNYNIPKYIKDGLIWLNNQKVLS